jgi:hypothetical protein
VNKENLEKENKIMSENNIENARWILSTKKAKKQTAVKVLLHDGRKYDYLALNEVAVGDLVQIGFGGSEKYANTLGTVIELNEEMETKKKKHLVKLDYIFTIDPDKKAVSIAEKRFTNLLDLNELKRIVAADFKRVKTQKQIYYLASFDAIDAAELLFDEVQCVIAELFTERVLLALSLLTNRDMLSANSIESCEQLLRQQPDYFEEAKEIWYSLAEMIDWSEQFFSLDHRGDAEKFEEYEIEKVQRDISEISADELEQFESNTIGSVASLVKSIESFGITTLSETLSKVKSKKKKEVE